MKKTARLLSSALILLLTGVAPIAAGAAEAWRARIVDVADGDTITAEPAEGGDRIKIRLHGIDTPERKQPYGESARGYTVKAALYRQATIHPQSQGKDRYGRIVAIVEIDGAGVLQEMLLEAGLAWVYPQYCKNCEAWEALQDEARAQGKGLWADEGAVPPWEWRKR
jgi:endonuclease YncB( thermonuclease family)